MPRVFRAMKRAADGLPVVEASAGGLGVRLGIDIDTDAGGIVMLNGKGMSVSPSWRTMSLVRIPKRLGHLVRGARGSDQAACFRFGEGPFVSGPFADGLTLGVDSATHGSVAPASAVPLADFARSLAATRANWAVEES